MAVVTLRAFAALRELVGEAHEVEATHVAELLGQLATVHGEEFTRRLERSTVVVNDEPVAHDDTTPLSDGEELRVGALRARVRHLPGHAPGHVVFVFKEAGLVIAGDTLFRGSIGRTDLPYGDEAALLAGIRGRLLNLPDATRVVPGHGPATTIGDERRTNPFLTGASVDQRSQPER